MPALQDRGMQSEASSSVFEILRRHRDTRKQKEIPKQKRYRHTPRKNRTPIGSCEKRLRGYIASVRNDALAIGSICVAHVGYMAQRNPPAIRPKKRLAGYVEDIVAINQVYLSHMQDTREVKKQSNRQGRKARQRPRYDTKVGPKNVL